MTELYESGIGLIYRLHTSHERYAPQKDFLEEDSLVSVRGKPFHGKNIYDSLTKSTTHVRSFTRTNPLPLRLQNIDALGRSKTVLPSHLFFTSISNPVLTRPDTPRH